ncbi:Uncharacterised protein [Porphyromonas macacae]|uniref:Uncharacterized protein n=1 Tax=Porphyromonas macacae TaxID=28115 RepID=A0A379E7L4_9PORP|nr:hypothetical protein [Porphyromonas macacae]SUB88666.1 Uncharacterised protein [Porphyromonas macacae]
MYQEKQDSIKSSAELEKARKKREEQLEMKEGRLIVVNGAKVKFNAHTGEFKVLNNVPAIQSKPVGTIIEKSPANFTFYDGFVLNSLATWQDFGTIKFQNNAVLLKKSKIMGTGTLPGSQPESGMLEFIDSGQINIPESITTQGLPVPDFPEKEKSKIEKDCIIEFFPKKKDYWEYGFDSYEETQRGCTDKEALKTEYKRYEIIGEKEEYFVPWVSIRKGQRITLKLKPKIKGHFEKIEIAHADFTFEPAQITPGTKQITVTCNALLENETLVEVKADGKTAGAINFFPNIPKKVKLRWVTVGINKGDIYNIDQIMKNKAILELYFKKAFNPAVIDIEVENTEPYKLIIPYARYKKYIEKRWKAKKKGEVLSPDFEVDSHLEQFVLNTFSGFSLKDMLKNSDVYKFRFIYYLKELLTAKYHVSSKDIILLFLTNLRNEVPEGELTFYNNGSTSKEENSCLMFLGNRKSTPDTEIPHEVMHALGVDHTFLEEDGIRKDNQKHLFNCTETNNYMDYNNKKITTWKWQWEIMRESANVW